jgi:ERCC4-type nuclease
MELIIDNRETKIKNFFENNDKYNNIVKFENLELGDFIIKYNDEIKYIFERKTIQDLANSIKDNRYHEQKQRFKFALDSNIKVSYIFESFRDYKSLNNNISICELKGNILLSGIVNTTLINNFGIFLTQNTDETIFLLEYFIDRMENNPDKYFIKNQNINHKCLMKKRKKENITKEKLLLLSLSQIPGISDKIATTISNKFNSIKSFINFLDPLEYDEKIKYLTNLEFKIKNNKVRKIGNKISERIVEFFF